MKKITKNMIKLKEVNYAILPSGEAGGKNADEQLRDLKTKVNMETDSISVDPQAVNEDNNDINPHYTHFAVDKADNKIMNGWDYTGVDGEDLKQFYKDYFGNDLIDLQLDPKRVKILSRKFLERNNNNPFDINNWKNNFNESKILTKKQVQENKLKKIVSEATIVEKKNFLLKENNELYRQMFDKMLTNQKYKMGSGFTNDFLKYANTDFSNLLNTTYTLSQEEYSNNDGFWGGLLPVLKVIAKNQKLLDDHIKDWQKLRIEASKHPDLPSAKKFFDKMVAFEKNVKGNAEQQARGETSKQNQIGTTDTLDKNKRFLHNQLVQSINSDIQNNIPIDDERFQMVDNLIKTNARMSLKKQTMLNKDDNRDMRIFIANLIKNGNLSPKNKEIAKNTYKELNKNKEVEKPVQKRSPSVSPTDVIIMGILNNNISTIEAALTMGDSDRMGLRQNKIDKNKIKNIINQENKKINPQIISFLKSNGLLESKKIILTNEQVTLLKESLSVKAVTKEDLVNKLLSIL